MSLNKAMILAAGLGTRMRPLTDNCPKPLLEVAGKPLIVYHLERMQTLGITDVVINVSYLAEKIIGFLGRGDRYGVNIQYSIEDEGPLGIIGGLQQARPLLGKNPFLLMSADVWFDGAIPEALLVDDGSSRVALTHASKHAAFFSLQSDGLLSTDGELMDYAGIAKFYPQHLDGAPEKYGNFIRHLITKKQIKGSLLPGHWFNVGSPEELQEAQSYFLAN